MAKSIKIANPVFDEPFKLLMQDLRIAKFLIGTIIGEEIAEIHSQPNDKVKIKAGKKVPRLLRFDFSARVKTKDGEDKLIAIEVQKALDILDVMRFRRYLAQMLEREDTVSVKNRRGKVKVVSNPLPVIGIYFLGRPFDEVDNNCIKLDHDLTDMQTGEKIKAKISFIERLMPKGFFIVFENLHPTLKTSLGRLLSLFVQEDFAVVGGKEIKYIREYKGQVDDPEILHIISTLQAATGDEKFIKAVEDEEASERFVRMLLEEEREKSEEAEKKAEEAEKKAEKAEAKAKEERRQKEATILVSIQALRSANFADEKIAEMLNISIDKLKK